MARNLAVFGIHPSMSALQTGVEALRGAGFRQTDISVLYSDRSGTKEFGHEAHTKAPEGAAIGAATGATVGGLLGYLAGIGALTIPGVGPFLAAGPIVAALAGIGAAGTTGGLLGAFIGMGIPEYEAKRYEGRLRQGGLLISVHCDDAEWVGRAKKVLRDSGAEHVAAAAEEAADYQP